MDNIVNKVKFLLVDGVLFHTLGILCKDERISFQEAIRTLFTKSKRSERLRRWIGNMYAFSGDYYDERGIDKPIKLIPVDEDCWSVIDLFCSTHKAEPTRIMQAMVTRGTRGEFTRNIIRRSYEHLAYGTGGVG